MSEISGFHNSINGDRKVKADFFARFFGSLIGNGVFPNPSTGLQVIANGDMTVTVKAGKGWINGVFYENDSDKIITLDVADGVLKRIDRIVLQYSTLDRTIAAKIKKGSFSSSPVASTLQRDGDAYELGIADILISNGAVSVTQTNITDLRLNSTCCGIVHGVIDQVDTTTLFSQYQTWYDEMTSASKAEFDNWMASLTYILSDDVAGNLLTLIQTNASDISAIRDKISSGTISTTWTGSTPPFTQAFSNANVTATNIVEISLASTATTAQTKAWDALKLKDGGQSAGSFTVKCWGVKNSVVIPIVISVRGD